MEKIDAVSRFLSKVEKVENGCWNWTGFRFSFGYGEFWLDKNITAHKASWVLFNGEIPKGLCVCHKCDNASCVNPDHLFLGTHKDNTQDMISKGRFSKQKPKLSEDQLNELNRLYLSGMNQRSIADKLGVHQCTVWKWIHKNFPIKNTCGEANKKAILTEENVREMRKLYEPRKFGFHKIAKLFGVQKSTAMRAIKGVSWKCVS